jgi:hypothetical protein
LLLIPIITLYALFVIPAIFIFLLIANGSILLLTLLRKYILKEVFIIPASIALFVLIVSLIGNILYPHSFSLTAHQFELDQLIDNFSIPFFIFFFVSLIANFISKPIANKINKKISFVLAKVLGIIGLILISFRDLFNLMGPSIKGTIGGIGEFISIFILLPLAILFYFISLNATNK